MPHYVVNNSSRVIGSRAISTSIQERILASVPPTPVIGYDAVSTSAEGEESLPESRNNLNENTEAVAAADSAPPAPAVA